PACARRSSEVRRAPSSGALKDPACSWRIEMAVREILVHLDSPEVVDTLAPAAAKLAQRLGAPALTLAALAEIPVHMSAAPLPLGLLKAREARLLNLLDRMETRARAAAPGVQIEWRGIVSPTAQT